VLNSYPKKIIGPNKMKNLHFIESEDEKKINMLIKKIKENNEKILGPLQEISNQKEKQIQDYKKKENEIERRRKRQEEIKLGIKDYLQLNDDEIEEYYDEDIEDEKEPVKESIFNKLVNLTKINSSNPITESSYNNPFNKYKLSKDYSVNTKLFDRKLNINELNNSNNGLVFGKSSNNNSYDFYSGFDNIHSKNNLHFDFKEDINKREKIIKDKFYEKAEKKPDFFGIRDSYNNRTTKTNKSREIIKFNNNNYINTERNYNSISNSRTSLRFNTNENNINLRNRGFPNNFIMPINPMNDVLSAKVNYLYGDRFK
jgi:hypothetical protein